MDSLRHGSTNPLRDAVKTIRIMITEQREYLVGIFLLLVVVFLWCLSNFVTQVRRVVSFWPYLQLIAP